MQHITQKGWVWLILRILMVFESQFWKLRIDEINGVNIGARHFLTEGIFTRVPKINSVLINADLLNLC